MTLSPIVDNMLAMKFHLTHGKRRLQIKAIITASFTVTLSPVVDNILLRR